MSERTPAQQRWATAITKRDMAGAAFQRAEEVATELDRAADQIATLNESVYRINQRLDGLESAAKADQDSKAKCANCGHPRFLHDGNGCNDRVPGSFGFYICPCKAFVPVAEPEPDDPICQRPGCGHPLSDHYYDLDAAHQDACVSEHCECEEFIGTPIKPDDIDPVLRRIADAYRLLWVEPYEETFEQPGYSVRVSLNRAFAYQSGKPGETIPAETIIAYGLRS